MLLGIEMIYQYTAMIPEMSIIRDAFIGRELLRWGWRGFGILDRRAKYAKSMAAIADLGPHIRDPEAKMKELSGGQQQGVPIARAIHFKSRIMIFGQPTNHLSVKETDQVLGYVKQVRDQGKTCIFISYNPYHAREVTDRTVAMSQGRKVADGTRGQGDKVDAMAMTKMIT